jgi:acetyltransferase-like isoleucine patch superfamily enzyme
MTRQIADLMTPMKNDAVWWERKNRLLRRTGIQIGRDVAVADGFYCVAGLEENITVEDYAVLGDHLSVYSFGEVKIGRFAMFAGQVTLSNGWHDTTTLEPSSGPLCIGAGAWLGSGVRVIGAVTVGEHAIVGAGAVVVGDLPPKAIAVGVPAKVIGYRDVADRLWHLGGRYFDPVSFQPIDTDH